MTIPKLHLPTEDSDFIKNPYKKMGQFREETPVFWDEINGLYFFTRYEDVRSIQSTRHSVQLLIILKVLKKS